MIEEIIAAGFGGQGVMLLGQVIAYTAIKKGMNSTWLPSYGPEMRGGTANCSLVVSTEEIGSPVVEEPSILICLNQPSVDKFSKTVKKGGMIIGNKSLIKNYPELVDIEIIEVPASEVAKDIGSDKVVNMVLLGALIAKRPFISIDESIASIIMKTGKSQSEIIELNRKAIESGFNIVKEKYFSN